MGIGVGQTGLAVKVKVKVDETIPRVPNPFDASLRILRARLVADPARMLGLLGTRPLRIRCTIRGGTDHRFRSLLRRLGFRERQTSRK